MANVKISNFPVPFALPVAAVINGTETLAVDKTVGGVVTTVSSTFTRLLGPISITSYANGGVAIAAPSSGISLVVNCVDNTNAIDVHDTTSTDGVNMRFRDSVQSRGYIGFGDSTFTGGLITDFGVAAGTSGSLRFAIANGSTTVMTMPASPGGASGQVNILPTSGQYGLQINQAGASFAAISLNASGATGLVSDVFLFQNTGAAGSGGGFIGTRNANAFNILTNNTGRMQIDGNGGVSITAPTAATTYALQISGASSQTIARFNMPTVAVSAQIELALQSVIQGYIGISGSAGALITGSATNDYCLRTQGGAFRVSANSGASSQLVLTGTAIGVLGGPGTAQDTGWGTPTGTILTTNFPGATATLLQTSESLARVIAILKNFGLLGA